MVQRTRVESSAKIAHASCDQIFSVRANDVHQSPADTSAADE